MILGHSVVLAKKSDQHVPGLERRTLSWYARSPATKPPPIKIFEPHPVWSRTGHSVVVVGTSARSDRPILASVRITWDGPQY